jgi:hypothetical protein
MFDTYMENEVAGDQQYKGRRLQIVGKVTRIGRDLANNAYVTLDNGRGKPGLFSVQCVFEAADEKPLGTLAPGKWVTIIGTGAGKFGNVLVKQCQLIPNP